MDGMGTKRPSRKKNYEERTGDSEFNHNYIDVKFSLIVFESCIIGIKIFLFEQGHSILAVLSW